MRNNKLFSLCLVLLLNACTTDFVELNDNKNDPKESRPATLLPSIIFEPINPHLTLQTWLSDQIMHYYMRRNDNQIDAYDFATGQTYFNDVWAKNYAALWNINEMITASEKEDGFNAYIAAGKILRAYYLATNTELWIDVPATQAGLGPENLTPSYDTQKTVYTSVLEDLKYANELLDDDASFLTGGDILFDGDIVKWKKLANSLRLRYLLRLSNKTEINAAAEIDTMVSKPAIYPIITSNDEAGIYKFSGTAPNVSSFSQQTKTSFSGLSMSKRMEDVYEVYDDPRIDFFFRLPTDSLYPNHEGVPNGLTREAAQSWNGNGDTRTSLLTTIFVDKPDLLNYTIISYAEVQFILAEAALKGWISTGAAETYYNQGIEANFEQWGLDMPTGFMQLPEVRWDGTLERLMDQKWMAFLFNNTIESWGEEKRTGLPALTIGPLATEVTDGIFPTRVFYPPLEQSINSTHYQEAVSNIGGDNITAPHWYQ